MKTPAIVFTGPGQVEVRDIDMPAPAAHQVQIQTRYSTVSAGTEGWCCRNEFSWAPTPYPCVPGYQRTGVITALGDGVEGWKVGDKVFASTGVWEGPTKPFWGSHVALANTWAGEVYRLPPGIDEIDASATVVAQVGYNAGYRPTLKAGDWVVVFGDGIIGQPGAQAARSRGARVIVVGHRAERLSLAAKYSADAVVNTRNENVVEAVRRIVGAKHVTAVIDTIQTVEAQKEYIDLLENWHGQIVYSGFTPGTCWADMALLQQRQLTCHNVSGWTRERMENTLALLAEKKMQIRPLITHLVPYTQGRQMWEMILAKSQSFMGITFDWTGASR